MKNWMWTALAAIMMFAIIVLLKMSFWIFLVIAAPLLTIIFIYGSFLYSFRESLQMEAVPAHGYNTRVNEMERELKLIEALGFRKMDQFYLKMIPDSITYVFKHQKEPFYFCLYHFGQKRGCDVVTRYENEFYLTTSNTVDAGMTPRPKKALLQIFPQKHYETLFLNHEEAHEYISRNGIRTYDIAEGEFRFYFMKSLREQETYIKKSFLWPVNLLIRTITRYGKIYCRLIQEQYPQGFSRINLYHAS